MRTRLLISMVIMMAVLTVIAPLITITPSAHPLLDSKGGLRAGAADLAEVHQKASAGLTASDTLAQTLAANKPQLSSERINPALIEALGIKRAAGGSDRSKTPRLNALRRNARSQATQLRPQSGQPQVLDERSALSAALITSIGGRDNQFSEVTLLADWDGREDCVADRELKIDDVSSSEAEIDETISRVALSEHTVANGFNENVFYRGNSLGCLCICGRIFGVEACLCICLPELINTGESGGTLLLNRLPGDCTDDQMTVTGIAVNPVSDLGDFGLCDTIGEVVYVSTLDTEGCASNAANQPFRTRIFALGFRDVPGGVAPVGAIQILRSPLANIAGLAVDDDSNLYFQLVDLINLQNGGAIFKVTETPRTIAGCGPAPRINRVIASIPNGLSGSIGLATATGSAANPALTSGGFRLTNYSGQSLTFGNLVSLASGQGNVLYAAVARSFNAADDGAARATEGAFPSPATLGSTPSMIISFADCSGGFDSCSSPASGIPGVLPVGDGFADAAQSGLTKIPGVNNFRLFVLGNGPDLRPAISGTSIVLGTPASLLKLDMQIDFTIHSGIAVNEEGTVFVISGGTPAGVGKNPSPMLGEILCFEDRCPADRRADFIDFRGDVLPNPPESGGNIGDGDSDRFDHLFHQAPLDQVTFTPAGLAGLARGFLRYTNRLAPDPISPGVTLGVMGGQMVQDDDAASGPIIFENLDPGHQVSRDFDFLFGAMGTPGSATMPCLNTAWTAFFLNSNGNITFGGGDTDHTPSATEFRSGLPKIAPAWADLNPNARVVNSINFPVQSVGFPGLNAFEVRWLNVPESGSEDCSSDSSGIGGNTTSVFIRQGGIPSVRDPYPGIFCYLDRAFGCFEKQLARPVVSLPLFSSPCFAVLFGCVIDEEVKNQTAFRYGIDPVTGQLIGCPPRLGGTGNLIFNFGRMALLGTANRPVITGYSEGGASPLNPPGLCETNLSTAASRAETSPFGVIDGQTASIEPCLIGQGTEPHLFELFNQGRDASIGAGGEVIFATPDLDLRAEGNDPALCTPLRQRDFNRGSVGFFGKTCPTNPVAFLATPVGTLAVGPGQPAVGSQEAGSISLPSGERLALPTSGIINAICDIQLNVSGCGFFPNETTTICPGFSTQTGVPLQRPGKTVSTSGAITCDTNGDGIPDAAVQLTNITPINRNLVRVTLPTSSESGLRGTAFPLSCCGGLADLTLTTTFTPGDNNQFGAFTRTTALPIDLGVRAPVVLSTTPSGGNCAVAQDLLISGACFIAPQGSITSVFAVDRVNPNNVIQATNFVVLNANLIDALFNFGSANAGKTFRIFVQGPGGTSRNLTALPQGAQSGCPLGNEQGVQVTFACDPVIVLLDQPVVSACKLERNSSGTFLLTVTGRNFQQGAAVTVGGKRPKKIRFEDPQAGSNTYKRLVLKGKFCGGLAGAIVVTNPGGKSASPFQCGESCSAQN
jgi:hypothetical protein